MKDVKLYGALVGITVIVASIAFWQAFISAEEPARQAEVASKETAAPDQAAPAEGMETEEEKAAKGAATAWIEALFATDMASQDYLAKLRSLSQAGFAETITNCFNYQIQMGEENELLAEARASLNYGYKNRIEISQPLVNIEGNQAGFSCSVLAHYPEDDSRFQVCAYLVVEDGAWKVADAFRRY